MQFNTEGKNSYCEQWRNGQICIHVVTEYMINQRSAEWTDFSDDHFS